MGRPVRPVAENGLRYLLAAAGLTLANNRREDFMVGVGV